MKHRKRWLATLKQTRLRLEVVYGETREEAVAEAERLADAASDEVWAEPEWNVASVNEVDEDGEGRTL